MRPEEHWIEPVHISMQNLILCSQMKVDLGCVIFCMDKKNPQHFQVTTSHDVTGSERMPLRYNYDKREKPHISRGLRLSGGFFVLFQTEQSGHEVVIS